MQLTNKKCCPFTHSTPTHVPHINIAHNYTHMHLHLSPHTLSPSHPPTTPPHTHKPSKVRHSRAVGLPLVHLAVCRALYISCMLCPSTTRALNPKASNLGLHVMLEGRGLALSQPVHIHYGHQVVQLVVGEGGRLPHTPLGTLPIPHPMRQYTL